MTKTIIGIFDARHDVEEAINELRGQGFNPKDISIVMRDKSQAQEIGTDTGADVTGGAASGATTGAIIGGLAGLLASFVIPGLGAFFIGGPIAAALGLTGAAASTVSGATTGAVAGGLLGALMGFGLNETEAKHYESRVEEGAILVAVPALEDETDIVKEIFDEYDATDIKTIANAEDTRGEAVTQREYAHHTYAGAKGGRVREHRRKRGPRFVA